jgi:diacylglycerol kinase (ATP)
MSSTPRVPPDVLRARLIINPASGSNGGLDQLPLINGRLREAVGDLDIVLTTGPGDATRAAEQAALAGYGRLFVGGGDGTLNEVLNGLAAVPGALERVRVGLLPLGTGNDFAAALGIPEDLGDALQIAGAARDLAVDLGWLGDRAFVNVSAGGFIAEVSDSTNETLKTLAGKLAYLIGGARVLFDYEACRARLRLRDGTHDLEPEMAIETFAVCNSRLVGGGKLIAPHALIDDGLLDVCDIEAMQTVDFVALLTRVAGGGHVEDPRVLYFRTNHIDLAFERVVKINTDGEVLETDRCTYTVSPQQVHFLAGSSPYSVR